MSFGHSVHPCKYFTPGSDQFFAQNRHVFQAERNLEEKYKLRDITWWNVKFPELKSLRIHVKKLRRIRSGEWKGGNETAQAFHLEKCNVVSSHSGFVSANSGQLLPMTFLYPNYNTLVYRGSFPKSRESFWSEKRRKTSRRWRVKPGLRFFALEPLEWNQKRNPGAWEEPIKWFYSQVCSNLLP